ncbi:heme uptake protein IsdC [Paenibacillus luteus]|uniref:heme uptake protein IsdC n=1 Tax=Paenibacillus luteus TaxID=2545753 RepID=UPI001143D898|nr:heme uptake protein IsdC [Paenibacillus luteus]
MRKLSFLIGFCALLVILFTVPAVHAAEVEDGTYTIDYVIKKAEDESASMANDYWEKPAKVIVENGKITIQVVVNHSKWVTEFKIPDGSGGYANTKVISSNKAEDSRVTQFSVPDLSSTMLSKIHVTVPDIDYDHDYTIRFDFDQKSMKLVSKPAVKEEKPAATAAPTQAPKATVAPKATQAPAEGTKQGAATAAPTSKPAQTAAASPAVEAGKATDQPAPTEASSTGTAESTAEPTAVVEPFPKADEESAVEASAAPSEVPSSEVTEETNEVVTASVGGDATLTSAELIGEAEPVKASSKRWMTSSIISVVIILAGVSFILIRNRKLKRK